MALIQMSHPFQEGNTPLHVCKTPELAKLLLGKGADPYHIVNKVGKTAFEMQTADIRTAIEDYKLFCGRFELLSLSIPEHATATSVMTRKHTQSNASTYRNPAYL